MRLLAICLMGFVISARAVLIDAIAITVGNLAITESEITSDLRLTALANGTAPDLSDWARQQAAGRLIEQALVRREMSFGSYPPIADAQVEAAYQSTEKARGGPASLNRLLASYDLTPQELREYLRWQLSLLKFIELRFRPAVEVTNEDIEKYYKETVQNQPGPDGKAPALADVRDQIEQKLTGERVDQQMEEWIKRSRARTAIRYIDATLRTR